MEGKQHDWTDQDFKCFVNMANSLIKLCIILFGLIKMIFAYQNEQVFFLLSLWRRITCRSRPYQLIIGGGHNTKCIKKGESMLDPIQI